MRLHNEHEQHGHKNGKTSTGLWIDHRKAVIAIVAEKTNEVREVLSDVDKQPGRYDGVRSTVHFESQQRASDGTRERDFHAHLNVFYDEVIAGISTAGSVFVFGPGEAKGELIKRLEKARGCVNADTAETADKMTNHQIVAKVRKHYLLAELA